ncbi:MAG TPA: Crp/Fnr family transcriptional regulator [Bacteroidetes bacterium]|nr:Crp/Fnr family transcriptional regulator [Bacteroidota bacterium]
MIKNNKCQCSDCQFRNVAFSTLGDSEVTTLCDYHKEYSFGRGGIIHKEDDPIQDFKYLKSGLVKVYKETQTGHEQIIAITKPFEFVSNISIFSEERYKYSVSAIEESVICSIKLDHIRSLVLSHGNFALQLMIKLSQISDKIILQTLDIRSRNLAGRVAYILLYFARDIYKSMIFELPVSRKEIADYISMSTANVIRSLSDFRKEGIIQLHGKTIEIVNPEKLEMISSKG